MIGRWVPQNQGPQRLRDIVRPYRVQFAFVDGDNVYGESVLNSGNVDNRIVATFEQSGGLNLVEVLMRKRTYWRTDGTPVAPNGGCLTVDAVASAPVGVDWTQGTFIRIFRGYVTGSTLNLRFEGMTGIMAGTFNGTNINNAFFMAGQQDQTDYTGRVWLPATQWTGPDWEGTGGPPTGTYAREVMQFTPVPGDSYVGAAMRIQSGTIAHRWMNELGGRTLRNTGTGSSSARGPISWPSGGKIRSGVSVFSTTGFRRGNIHGGCIDLWCALPVPDAILTKFFIKAFSGTKW